MPHPDADDDARRGGGGFRLPESEWGLPDECLVIAGYRGRAHWLGLFPDPPRGVFFYRVLEPGASGWYGTPIHFEWFTFGVGGMVPITPYFSAQCEPMHVVFSARGTYGIRDQHFDPERTPWPIERCPRVTRVWWKFRVTGAPDVEPALSMDCWMGYVLCRILLSHDPGHRGPPPREAISRADADRIAQFVAEHASCFSLTTQLLSRRLADRYAWNAPPGIGLLSHDYQRCTEPRLEQVIRDLPEEEREYFERLRDELVAGAAPGNSTGGWNRRWSKDAPHTCDVCGQLTYPGTLLCRPSGHLPAVPGATALRPYWRESEHEMLALNVCDACYRKAVDQARSSVTR